MRQAMLTTIDNPFDPFTDFNSWFLYDISQGNNTCAYLGRIARTSDALPEKANSEEIERAIDEILQYDFAKIYKKVVKED